MSTKIFTEGEVFMKKIATFVVTVVVIFCANCLDRAEAWVNQDIKKGLNARIETISPEMKTYLDTVMAELKKGYKESDLQKNWQSQICFQIDKKGNVYDKNYVIKDGYWINEDVEYAMMKLNKLPAPPKEYKQEVIFVTFKHVPSKTEIYFTNVNEN